MRPPATSRAAASLHFVDNKGDMIIEANVAQLLKEVVRAVVVAAFCLYRLYNTRIDGSTAGTLRFDAIAYLRGYDR